ncbi:O-antigen export system permease protein RfbD [hydrothermal vent metagenome]|uniref:O-antigen export system permease protein RfbD n=1 Tax=hydrothermal vent metagenome TaxID=652676 RepID=A0A1W1CZT1_9ZZZZ
MLYNIVLAFGFAKRDFKERYVGTGLGQLWYLISPVITILIYTVIFSDVMKRKLDIVDNSYSYSIYIVSGLLAWISFSRTLTILSNLVAQKSNLIKKINVPMYVFYLSVFITESILLFLSMSLGVLFLIIIEYHVDFTFLWMLPIVILQMIFVLGLGVIISLFMPFLKDIKEVLPIVIQLWFWMTPIIYIKEMVASKYPFIFIFNPFYYYVHLYQNIFLYAKSPTLYEIIIITSISFSTLSLAAFLYKKMISTIKDII